MKKLTLNTVTGLAVVALVTGMAANSAIASSKLVELDGHAWTLERTAIRADRDVRYDFRHAPVAKCLRENFCMIVEKADDLQKTIGRKADPRMLRDIEDCLDEIDESFAEILEAMDQLKAWNAKCRPQTIRYGSVRFGFCAANSKSDLQRLCARVDLMKEILRCMFDDLEKLFCECGIKRPHTHDDHRAAPRAPAVPEVRHNRSAPRGQQPILVPRQTTRGRSLHGVPTRRPVSIPIGSSRNGFRISFSF